MRHAVKPFDLFFALKKAWSCETSSDGENWNVENPTWGQCAVTALVVQDFFGGQLLRTNSFRSKHPQMVTAHSHYFNRIQRKLGSSESEYVDFTESQFENKNAFVRLKKDAVIKSREHLLPENPSPEQIKFKERYKLLRLRVTEILGDNNQIFLDPIYQKCLSLALDSDCQKGKYGCVIKYANLAGHSGVLQPIATFNRQLDPLKNWCDPECVRMHIPSRTESMIGACGHAEELAIAEALSCGLSLNECELYVAGFLSNGLAYIKDEPEFTCLRCAIQIYIHKVGIVYVPTKRGWAPLSAEKCVKTAQKYALQEKSLPQSP
ncbi:MAG: hypothetical protein AAB795_02305 [Patescibacteria group bacterium]